MINLFRMSSSKNKEEPNILVNNCSLYKYASFIKDDDYYQLISGHGAYLSLNYKRGSLVKNGSGKAPIHLLDEAGYSKATSWKTHNEIILGEEKNWYAFKVVHGQGNFTDRCCSRIDHGYIHEKILCTSHDVEPIVRKLKEKDLFYTIGTWK